MALEHLAQRAALDAHYEAHPEVRPSLAEVALALALMDHNPIKHSPDLIERAAREVVLVRPDADPDDVLLWAIGLQPASE